MMNRAGLKQKAKDQLGNKLFGTGWIMAVCAVIIVGAITGGVNSIPYVGWIISLVVGGPLAYSLAKLFIKQSYDGKPMELGNMFDGFKEDFGCNVLLYIMQVIFITLWSLLLIVPGIIKMYEYKFIFYVKADHPEYTWKECFAESKRLTNGHKMDMFVLSLSFIGWAIVGTLCVGVGSFWVAAYQGATFSQLYKQLKEQPVVE